MRPMGAGAPAIAPLGAAAAAEERGEGRWQQLDSSVNAVSFGFVATAILVSMFLVMAIFEHFLRPRSPLLPGAASSSSSSGFFRRRRSSADLEAHRWGAPPGKLDHSSPEVSVYSKVVSVLMPGHDTPTFIARPGPVPCPLERISWPSHQPNPFIASTSNLS